MSSSSSTASRCLKNCRREFRREFDELVGVEDDRPDEEELDRQNQIRYKNTIINLQRILHQFNIFKMETRIKNCLIIFTSNSALIFNSPLIRISNSKQSYFMTTVYPNQIIIVFAVTVEVATHVLMSSSTEFALD